MRKNLEQQELLRRHQNPTINNVKAVNSIGFNTEDYPEDSDSYVQNHEQDYRRKTNTNYYNPRPNHNRIGIMEYDDNKSTHSRHSYNRPRRNNNYRNRNDYEYDESDHSVSINGGRPRRASYLPNDNYGYGQRP